MYEVTGSPKANRHFIPSHHYEHRNSRECFHTHVGFDIRVRNKGRSCSSPQVSPLLLFVGVRFQVSFTPLAGVLFTFPSRY